MTLSWAVLSAQLYSRVTLDLLFRAMPTMQKKWWQYVPGPIVQPYDCNY